MNGVKQRDFLPFGKWEGDVSADIISIFFGFFSYRVPASFCTLFRQSKPHLFLFLYFVNAESILEVQHRTDLSDHSAFPAMNNSDNREAGARQRASCCHSGS